MLFIEFKVPSTKNGIFLVPFLLNIAFPVLYFVKNLNFPYRQWQFLEKSEAVCYMNLASTENVVNSVLISDAEES
jgi:hypothetical protein